MKTSIAHRPRGKPVRPSRLTTRRVTNRPTAVPNQTIDLVPARLKLSSILVPIDFSPESDKALRYAIPFAEQFGARLTVVYVVQPLPAPDFATFPLVMENDKVVAACRAKLLERVRRLDLPPRLIEKTLVRQGQPAQEITDAARTLKADLIIIATHGYTGIKHAVLGSTAERVVRHAPCPVLVVREREHEFI